MPITNEQMVTILSKIEQKTATYKMGSCPMCGGNDWQIGNGIAYLLLQSPGPNYAPDGYAIPCVPLICVTCGCVILRAMEQLGLTGMLMGEAK